MMRTARSSGRSRPARRAGVAVAGVTALSLLLVACGGNSSPGGSDGDQVTIRYSWWGSDARTERMQQAIDEFTELHPNIRVVGEFTDFTGYWDKLATSVAGGSTPDVFMQEDRYIGDYARRGVLADLGQYDSLSYDDIEPALLSSGNIDDVQYGIPTGANVYAVIANPSLFEAAGVELPDDSTWTWEDYEAISHEISENSDDGVYGTSDYTTNEVAFAVYARQHGQSLYAEDGTLGYDDALLAEWFERSVRLAEAGSQPPADATIGGDVSTTPIATNTAAMAVIWSAQLIATSEAAGTDMVLLRMPGETQFDREGMYFKPGMYLSMSEQSEHPEEAAMFIDYFVNETSVGDIFLDELGLPGNLDVRQSVIDQMSDEQRVAADFISDVEPDIIDAPPPMPLGAGEIEGIMIRINEQVLFGQLTPEEGAAQFRTEAESAIG